MMDIAILVKEFPPDVIGGTETQTKRMARELDATGHDVTIYTKKYPHNAEESSLPYEVIRVPNWRISSFVSTLTFVLVATLFLIRDAEKYDLLQCMMIYPNGFVGEMVNEVCGLPYFAWIRGGDYYFMKENIIKRRMIRSVLEDTLVLVQTERIADDVRSEFTPTDLRVLGNGVDIPNDTADGCEIVYVGRLKEQKGVQILLRAATDLDEQILIVGDGPSRSRLESLAKELEVNAEFVGEVPPDSVGDYLRRGKLFVLPSVRGEGLPNAILEAMAFGLPVVVTDTGGVVDAVQHGKTGYVVDPGDAVALRDRIAQISQSQEKSHRMGQAARQWVIENHGWKQIVGEVENVYESILDDPSNS